MTFRIVSLIVSIVLLVSCSKETITPEREVTNYITGKVLGFDNKPMKLAHVHAYIYGKQKKDLVIEVNTQGEFSIPIKSADFIELEFTGVDHKMTMLELFNFENDKDINFTVTLTPNSINESLTDLKVLGSFNNYSFETDLVPMTSLGDGMYEAIIHNDDDTLFYQILGATVGARSINGTMSHGFVYDGGGDYRSYLVAKDTIIKIIYDIKKLSAEAIPVKYSSADESLTKYFRALDRIAEISDLAIEVFNNSKDVFKYYSYYFDELNNLIKDQDDNRIKMLIMQKLIDVAYATNKSLDKELLKSHLDKIGPFSVYWEKNVSLVIPALELLKDKKYKEDFINQIIYKNPSEIVRQRMLYNLASFYFDKEDKVNGLKYYNILVNTYPDSKITKSAKKEYSPDRKIIIGKTFPKFSFENIEKAGEMITNETFAGKYCLIDIWATWCGPCVGEMETLHNINKKFNNKNFAMYSISIDAKKEDIDKFRNGKWKMPWLHSFSSGIWKSKVVEIFEVSGVPQPMLISPDGKILEIGVSLRGDVLEQTLNKYLK